MSRILAIALLASLATPTAAAAQMADVVDVFQGIGDEGTNRYLNMIFGPLFPGENDETILSRLITGFNLLFLSLGLALLVYNMIVAVTQTAHDGVILGRRSSSLWAPIRTVVAAALLIPLPSGYNGVQHLAAYVAQSGTAAATLFWNETADAIIDQRINVAGIDYTNKDAVLIAAIFRLELCRAAYNHEVAKAGGAIEPVRRVRRQADEIPILSYDSTGEGDCGQIIMPARTRAFERIVERDGRGSYDQYVTGMFTFVERLATGIGARADAAVEAAANRTPLAPEDINGHVQRWRDAHRQTLATVMGSDVVQDDLKDIVREGASYRFSPLGETGASDVVITTSMKDDGWSQAGFYYQTIARLSADTASVAGAMPIVSHGNLVTSSGNTSGRAIAQLQRQVQNWQFWRDREKDASRILGEIQATYASALDWFYRSARHSSIQNIALDRRALGDHVADVDAYMPSAGDLWMHYEALNPSTSGAADPLVTLIQLGQKITAKVTAVIGSLTALGAFPFITGAMATLVTLIGWVVSGIGALAATVAFILPMLPTLVWVLAVAAYFVLVIQAVFAGPLWAIAHLSLEGEGLAGRSARRGYMLLLSVFLTPLLMVLGLLCGMVLFRIVGTLYNGGIYLALSGSQSLTSEGFVGIGWWLGMIAVLAFIVVSYLVIIERSFRLITWLPTAVLGVLDQWVHNVGIADDAVTGAQEAQGQVRSIAVSDPVKLVEAPLRTLPRPTRS